MFRSTAARQATTFVALTFAMALGVALALPRAGVAPFVSLFTPLISVLIITFVGTRRGHRRAIWRQVGLHRAGLRSWPVAIAVPVLVVAVAYGAAAAMGVATLRGPDLSPHGLATSAPDLVINLVLGTVLILGEEIGWRGYLLPRLQELVSRRRAAVTTGLLHGLFHLPLILLTTTYDSVGSRYLVAPAVVLTITCAGVFYAWLRDRSGSIWPVAIAHNAANTAFDLGAAVAVTSSPVALAYVAGESGIATLLAVVGFATILLAHPGIWRTPAGVLGKRPVGADRLAESR